MTRKRNEALLNAIKRNDLKRVQGLLDRGADVNAADADGWTPLMWAVASGRKEAVSLLLDKGAELNARDKEDNTALIHAAMAHPQIAEVLIARGADLNAQNKVGTTALMWAIFVDNKNLARNLIARGADLNKQNNYGQSALMTAIAHGSTRLASDLVRAGADVRLKNKGGFTALMLASCDPKVQSATLVRLLLEKGADMNARDLIFKRTALEWAIENKVPDAEHVLRENLLRYHSLNRRHQRS